MAWTISRAMPNDATSSNQWQWHSQSYLLLYIHMSSLEPGISEYSVLKYHLLLQHLYSQATRAQSSPKYGITTKNKLSHCLLPFFPPLTIFSPPCLLRNSFILPKVSLENHSDTSKCLLKGLVLSAQPETPQTLSEHWPLRSLFTYNTCASSICLLLSHLVICW